MGSEMCIRDRVIPLELIDKYDAYVGRYVYLCGNENRERIDFVSIIMAKELIDVYKRQALPHCAELHGWSGNGRRHPCVRLSA